MQKTIYGTRNANSIFTLEESTSYEPVFFRLLRDTLRVWKKEGTLTIVYTSSPMIIAEIVKRSKISLSDLEAFRYILVHTELQTSCCDFLFTETDTADVK